MSTDTIGYAIADRLYLNITDRCTLRCSFCPKHNGSRQVHQYDLTLRRRPESDQVIGAVGDPTRYSEVVFCGYGEPTLRLGVLLAVARHVKECGGRVRVNTDGLANRAHRRNVLPALGQWVDALSVSLNAQNASLYAHYCRPALVSAYPAVLNFLQMAPRYIEEVTATAIDGLDGVDIEACERIARRAGVKFRRRVLDVVG